MGQADVSYNRLSAFFRPGQYCKLVDYEGNEAFFKIVRVEPMGVTRVQWASSEAVPADPGLVTLPAGTNTGNFEAEWLEPPRENRLYQITPYFEFRWINNQALIPAEADDAVASRCVLPQHITCSVDLRVFNPSGTRRLGVSNSENITVNTIQQLVGGLAPTVNNTIKADAVIPHYLMPLRDDLSHVWDLWTIFGNFPAFDIVNRSKLDIGGNLLAEFPVDAFLCFTGRRYMLDDVTEDELYRLDRRTVPKRIRDLFQSAREKAAKEETDAANQDYQQAKDELDRLDELEDLEFRGITIGGVTQVTTRA